MPEFNQNALDTLIAAERKKVESINIRTASEAMLEDNEAKSKELEATQAAYRLEISRLAASIEALTRIKSQMEVNENDIAVQLAVVNTSVHTLKQAGVTLPTRESAP